VIANDLPRQAMKGGFASMAALIFVVIFQETVVSLLLMSILMLILRPH
jgi:hypothetical protein